MPAKSEPGAATISAKVTVANFASPPFKPHYVFGPDHINSFTKGQYVGRLDLWFPKGAVTPGGVPESGLTLGRAEVNVLPGKSYTAYLVAVVPHAVRDGVFTLNFVPQSTLSPQVASLSFSANGWSWSGPDQVHWIAKSTKTFSWQLSH